MAKRKKKKKYRGFRLFVKIQAVLILLVIGALVFYYCGGYAKKIEHMKSEAYDFVHSTGEDAFSIC